MPTAIPVLSRGGNFASEQLTAVPGTQCLKCTRGAVVGKLCGWHALHDSDSCSVEGCRRKSLAGEIFCESCLFGVLD